MKKKLLKINLSVFKYLLFTPFLLLTLCQTNNDPISLDSQKLLTKDAKVISLMKDAIKSDLQKTLSKSEGIDDVNTQCTHFLYPMTFEVYSGDDPNPQIMEINSDDELIAFIDTLNTSNQFYIFFPITLLDGDGVETIINDLVELEGTLQMAVDACAGFNNDDSSDDSDPSSDNGSDDDSDHGSGSDSDDDSDHSSDDGSDDDSNHDSDSSSDDDSSSNHEDDSGSDDDSSSNHDSDSSSDDDSSSNHDSDSSSDDNSSSNHDDDSDSSDDHSDDVSNDDHDEYQYCEDNNKKVYICHNGITICVSVNAIWGHMTHHEDDYLGRCEE